MKRRNKHLDFIIFAIAWGFIQCVRLIPIQLCSLGMGKLWRTIAPFTKRHKRAIAHIQMAMPHLNVQEHETIILNMWENLGKVTAEALQLDKIIKRKNLLTIDTPEIIEALRENSKGAIIVSLHAGNWELTALPNPVLHLNVMGVYQAVQNPFLNAYVHKLRAPFWPAGLLTKSHGTARKLLAHVRDGGIIGMLADVREHKGIEVPFFGHLAPSNSFPAMVAAKYNAPIYAARVVRYGNLQFRLEMVKISYARTDSFDENVYAATAAIQMQFETWISQTPAQWMWAHRRWGRDIQTV